MNRFRLDGKLVLITGASSGIGAHAAKLMASVGARVALAARSSDKLAALAQELNSQGYEARAFSLDVTSASKVKQCFEDIAKWDVPDVIINNAGVAVTKALLEQTEEDYDYVMDTNLKGIWLVATEAARQMVRAKKGGCIVNIASIAGVRQSAMTNPYNISKAGVLQATKVMALELARNDIRVNALMPGYIITDLNREFLTGGNGQRLLKKIPTRRYLELEDLDGPLLLMTSEAGSAMTGSVLAVDGGHLVSSL